MASTPTVSAAAQYQDLVTRPDHGVSDVHLHQNRASHPPTNVGNVAQPFVQQTLALNHPPLPYPQNYQCTSEGYLLTAPNTIGVASAIIQPGGMNVNFQEDIAAFANDGEDDDDDESELSDGDVLKEDIDDALCDTSAWFKGSYYHANLLASAPNPCLHIAGLGLVGLPLSERDAKSIIACATQAPFGRGERTVVDKSVRDTWEIEPTRITFGNPEWGNFINDIVLKQVCQTLGVTLGTSPPRMDLYKLLLYEKGSHFLPHQDTQKADGMFATVIIVLPSAYTGGEVVVSSASHSKVIDFAANSQLSTALLAWYTDVRHEVKPITAGYRLALSFNLIHTAPPGIPKPALPQLDSSAENLRRILLKWRDDRYSEVPDPPLIAYILDHQYSQANLREGIKCLKGADLHRVAFLRDVAEELGFCVGLARLSHHMEGSAIDGGGGCYYEKRRRYGYYDDYDRESTPDMDEVESETTSLEGLVGLDGTSILSVGSIDIGEDCFLPTDYFSGEAPDKTEYEGYMGNYAGNLEQWYHRTALVLMHLDDIDNICFSVGGVSYALDKVKNASFPPTEDDRSWASRILNRYNSLNAQQAATMLNLALKWDDRGIWRSIMMAPACTLQSIDEKLLFEGWRKFSFATVRQGFEDLITRSKQLPVQIAFLQHVQLHAQSDEKDVVSAWCKRESDKILTSYNSADPKDVPTIISIILLAGLSSFNTLMLPNLIKRPNTYTFWIAFIKAIRENHQAILARELQLTNPASDTTGPSTSQVPSTAIAMPSAGPTTKISPVDALLARCLQAAALQWSDGPAQPYYSYLSVPQTNKVDRIVEIVQLALELNNIDLCRTLFINILKSKGTAPEKFERIYRPLITRLRPLLQAKNYDIFVSPFVDVYQILIGSYLREILGKKPPVTNARLRRIGCGCPDCQSVDTFILDPLKTNQLFRLVKPRRLHLEKYIAAAKDLCTYKTINYGSPHGVDVTKRPEIVAASMWGHKQNEARKFLATIGADDVLKKIMGPRYPDVVAAVNGVAPFGPVTTGLNRSMHQATVTATPSSSTGASLSGQASTPVAATSTLNSSAVLAAAQMNAGINAAPLAGQKRKTNPSQPAVSLGTIDLTEIDSN